MVRSLANRTFQLRSKSLGDLKLTKIDLRNTRLGSGAEGDATLKKFAESLGAAGSVTDLDLAQNFISAKGFRYLEVELPKAPLRYLSFAFNSVGRVEWTKDEGRHPVDASGNPVDVSDPIAMDGPYNFAMVLPFRIKTLETFDATEMGVDANGIFVYATYGMMLPLNLKFLLLDGNPIGKSGLEDIVRCLVNQNLRRVTVQGWRAEGPPRPGFLSMESRRKAAWDLHEAAEKAKAAADPALAQQWFIR